jgi:isoleucyl-tRNA synthetase
MHDFTKIESKAREVWEKHQQKIKNALKTEPKKPLFSFLEGPPTANAPPGLHHLEVRTFKDIICKYKYMNGFSVPRKGGWDCHGLPVEVQIEKKLGLNSKKEVIKYGTEKFINDCRESVFSNINEWKKSTEELSYWIDLENSYITLTNDYIESVWWALKEMHKKGFLYEGHKVVPFCPRCGTPLSSHEVAQGYKDVKEESVYIAFKVKGKKNEYILAWTTTPWTLPGNVALAVGADINYVKVKLSDGDFIVIGKERLNVIRGEYEIVSEMKGQELIGLEYEPLFDIKELKNENSYKIIEADFVSTEDGTGIVHTAGMYGEEDYNVCKKNNLPLVHTVEQDGTFNHLVENYKGKFVKSVEEEIKQELQKKHLLYKKEKLVHAYPFCWRCDSPLLYYAINSWFIKVSEIRDRMVELNKEINWYPEHIKDGRFGKWLEGAKDWALSRFKFWGTPLPIWKCVCGEIKTIGSIEELKKESTKKITGEIDLHKPWIDKIKLKCKCGKEMSRIPDVIDCWFDSGSASFAQFHYPFENKKEFEARYPYDFISEAIDQTRGWFYTLHVIGTILFDKPAFNNVICAGHIVDDRGEKMSKTKGNIIKPREIIDSVGVDAVRLQFCTSDAGNFKRFSIDSMKEIVLPFLTVLENCNNFYQQTEKRKCKKKIEDKWILSRLNSMIKNITGHLDEYNIDKPFDEINRFVVNDFSRTYIKMTRERDDTNEILAEVLKKISLVLAPYAPYISEYIYNEFSNNSVHLEKWPKVDEKMIDIKLEEEFNCAMQIIEKGLSARDKIQIGLKWPLKKANIKCKNKLTDETIEIIKTQLNVKQVLFESSDNLIVELDSIQDEELISEGYSREISRKVQDARKKAGFIKEDIIILELFLDKDIKELLEKNKSNIDFIKNRVNSKELKINSQEKKDYKHIIDDKIKGKQIKIMFSKV